MDEVTGRVRRTAAPSRRLDRVLGHPAAFFLTAGFLVALFGGPFLFHPGRPAPANDPAAYAWRAETIMSERPQTFLEVDGPDNMLTAGYRVATPVAAALLRRIAEVSSLVPTLVLMIGIRCVTPLLLAGIAYRELKDPLAFHTVAIGTASVLSTVLRGYLDNTLALALLVAALYLIAPARSSWPARAGLGLLLIVCGFTHPTTLAVFCAALALAALSRMLLRRAGGDSSAHAPLASVAVIAVVVTAVAWTAGIWGQGVSLTEAGTSPPGSKGFFMMRLFDWLLVLQPWFNLPLLLIGVVLFVRVGRSVVDEDSYRVALIWLLPIVGIAGVLFDVAYPYHRFLNVAISWVMFTGLGTYAATRWLIDRLGGTSSRARTLALAGLGVLALGIGANFVRGFEKVGFNAVQRAWITPQERADLDLVRQNLEAESERPVVFVADTDRGYPVRIFAFIKRIAHVSRYGLVTSQQDRAYVYLGTLSNFLAGRATPDPRPTYGMLSQATIDDFHAGDESTAPIVVLTRSFNRTGANTELTYRGADLASPAIAAGLEVWVAADRTLTRWSPGEQPVRTAPIQAVASAPQAGPLHILRVLTCLALLLLPGWLLARWIVPGATMAELLGLVPALAVASVALAAIALIAVTRSPFTQASAWASLGTAVALCAGLNLLPALAPPARRPLLAWTIKWLD